MSRQMNDFPFGQTSTPALVGSLGEMSHETNGFGCAKTELAMIAAIRMNARREFMASNVEAQGRERRLRREASRWSAVLDLIDFDRTWRDEAGRTMRLDRRVTHADAIAFAHPLG